MVCGSGVSDDYAAEDMWSCCACAVQNFLPPQGLVMGLGFMFKLEDSCIGRHVGERAVRGGLEDEEEGEQQQQQQQGGAGSGDDAEGDDTPAGA